MSQQEHVSKPPGGTSMIMRFLPLIVVGALMVAVFATGLHKYLSLEVIGRNYDALTAFISNNLVLSLLIYAGIYIAVTALSLPGALALTLAGGLLFGWQIGAPVTILAATLGASLIFLIAKSSVGDSLAAKAGPAVAKLRAGFQEDAFSYLLFLRLVPAFPFFIVNIAPALLGVKLRTFFFGTLLGIIPGSTAFSFAASQLGTVIEKTNADHAACVAQKGEANCTYSIDTSALVSKEIIFAFAAIGVVALIPVVLKKWRARNGAA
ncbi:MAG: VTT domain-containing protein [Pseudomonadota bacterium]